MNDEKVVRLVPESVGDGYYVDPDVVLTEAIGEYTNVVVVGQTEDGALDVVGSSTMGEANLLLDLAKKHLLDNL